MNGLLTAAAACGIVAGFWFVADAAARRRGLELGAPPYHVLAAIGILSGWACLAAGPAAGIAWAGVGVAGCVDFRTGYIFDALVAVSLVSVFAAALAGGQAPSAAAGAAVTAGSLLAIYGASARRGLGLGDVKLGIVVGAGLGWAAGVLAVGSAFVLGAVAALGLIALGRARRGQAVRFGPYLAAGTLVSLAYHRLNASVP